MPVTVCRNSLVACLALFPATVSAQSLAEALGQQPTGVAAVDSAARVAPPSPRPVDAELAARVSRFVALLREEDPDAGELEALRDALFAEAEARRTADLPDPAQARALLPLVSEEVHRLADARPGGYRHFQSGGRRLLPTLAAALARDLPAAEQEARQQLVRGLIGALPYQPGEDERRRLLDAREYGVHALLRQLYPALPGQGGGAAGGPPVVTGELGELLQKVADASQLHTRLFGQVRGRSHYASQVLAELAAQDRHRPTRWPIVLVHGMAGFKEIGPVEYFQGVPQHLRQLGYQVVNPATRAFDSIEDRAKILKAKLLERFPDPEQKLNLIGHSMGGLDSRYMISRLGMADRVASLTTIATPHRGSPVADVTLGVLPDRVEQRLDRALKRIGWDLRDQGINLSVRYMTEVFNPATPDAPGVYYQSYCGEAGVPTLWRPTRAIIDPLLAATWAYIGTREGKNDGLVSISSSRWGVWRGELPANHLSEVGQIRGTVSFDHLAFFAGVCRDLARRGY